MGTTAPHRAEGPPIRSVLVCGAGAVGSSYAARLHQLDPAGVALVATGERRARLDRDGLTVNGRTFHARTVARAEEHAPADLVLVAVKQHHLPAAIEDLRPFVAGSTTIVSLLNGITSEAILGDAFSPGQLLPAFVVGNDVVRHGSVTRYSSIGTLVFGAPSNDPADPRVTAVKELLDRAGIPSRVPRDILREQWWKFMLNVGVNQVSAVLRAPYRAFRDPEVRELTRRASLEVVAIAQREGIALEAADVEGVFPVLATLGPEGKTSMLQDVEAGRKTEVEIFAGTVVEMGRRHGLPTPVNELLGMMIRALERLATA